MAVRLWCLSQTKSRRSIAGFVKGNLHVKTARSGEAALTIALESDEQLAELPQR
jgi:hypothetical protein